jgi:hypothetical protein
MATMEGTSWEGLSLLKEQGHYQKYEGHHHDT